MFGGSYAPSVADIAAIDGNRNNGYDGFGGGWWAWIILLALFGGFGNRGFGWGNGFNGCNSCCTPATCAEVQNGFNNANVQSMLNGIENGICSLGYDQLNQMNGINQNVMQTGFGLQQAINNMGVAQMQDTNALSRQLADCCCENREAISNVRFDLSTGFCNVSNAINQAAQTIVQNDNANFRALHDELVAYRMQDKDETIAELRSQVSALNLGISQRNQNDYLVGQLRPCPIPAYNVPNPYAYYNGCGCNSGCNPCCG